MAYFHICKQMHPTSTLEELVWTSVADLVLEVISGDYYVDNLMGKVH